MTASRLVLLAAAVALTGVIGARCQAPEKVALVLAGNSDGDVQADQHFSGCREARAAGRHNIPVGDPSYREWMDGDGDGLACEDYHGPSAARVWR